MRRAFRNGPPLRTARERWESLLDIIRRIRSFDWTCGSCAPTLILHREANTPAKTKSRERILIVQTPRYPMPVSWKGIESSHMAKAKEFTVTIADKPGALGKCFLALAERGVNVLAFQSYVEEGESLARFVADDTASAKAVLGSLRMIFEETEVAVVRLAHRPGELGRAASRLGENHINIDYSYCGMEPGSTLALLVFGVDSLTKAATLLDKLAAEVA